jgi:hypothetical protein
MQAQVIRVTGSVTEERVNPAYWCLCYNILSQLYKAKNESGQTEVDARIGMFRIMLAKTVASYGQVTACVS